MGCDFQPLAHLQNCQVASLFITNDSGLMHVACAMKVPTVAIFGPTDPAATAPLGVQHIIVKKDFPCQPCWPIELYGNRPKCKYTPPYRCLLDLSVEEVFEATKVLLQNLEMVHN